MSPINDLLNSLISTSPLIIGFKSEIQDSNLRPLRPERSALPSWANFRNSSYKRSAANILKRILPRLLRWMHPAGVEPATFWFVVRHSIQLRYGCKKAEDGIRTRDPHHGKVMFYHWTTSANVLLSFEKLSSQQLYILADSPQSVNTILNFLCENSLNPAVPSVYAFFTLFIVA